MREMFMSGLMRGMETRVRVELVEHRQTKEAKTTICSTYGRRATSELYTKEDWLVFRRSICDRG